MASNHGGETSTTWRLPMRNTLVLEGLGILAVIILLIDANWQWLTKEPEEDDP
jgi:hypothetical protein